MRLSVDEKAVMDRRAQSGGAEHVSMSSTDPEADLVSEHPVAGRSRGRGRTVVAGVVVVLLCAGTWAVARVSAPDVVSHPEPPSRVGPLMAPAERRVLEDAVVVRGTVSSVGSIEVTVVSASDIEPIISGVPMLPGDEVSAGDVVLEVSGRPILALEGTTPAYRDLQPGAQGGDVAQLQDTLANAGFPVDGESGTYGPKTSEAVEALYRASGYEPPRPTLEAQAELESAESELEAAQDAVTEAADASGGELDLLELQLGLDEAVRQLHATEASTAESIASAENARDAAQQAVAAGAGSAPEQLALKAALDQAEVAVSQARRDAELSTASAQDAVTLAQARLDGGQAGSGGSAALQSALVRAQTHYAEALADDATPLPRGEVVLAPSLPTLVTDLAVNLGDKASAGDAALVLSASTIGVVVDLAPETAQLVTAGLTATVTDERLSEEHTSTVTGPLEVGVDRKVARRRTVCPCSSHLIPSLVLGSSAET